MRLFVSVEISEALRESLLNFKTQIEPCAKNTKWMKAGNLHMTLKFFGETGSGQAGPLEQSLAESARGEKVFSVELQDVGAFPSLQHPRVLWAGIQDPDRRLATLAAKIEEKSVAAGFAPSDKPFSAHLTLARFNGYPGPLFLPAVKKNAGLKFGEIRVERIALVQSVLSSAGPVYTSLKEFPLEP